MKRENLLQRFAKHPYFGFVIAGVLLVLVQVLQLSGVVGGSMVRAFGQTIAYFVVALGFTILFGYAGLASLGTAGFVGLGTYIIGHVLRTMGLPLVVALILAVLIAVVLGGVVGFISLRIEGMYLAIITLGLSEILNEVFKNAVDITNGTNGFSLGSFKIFGITLGILDRAPVYFILVFACVLAMIATINLIQSPTGRAMLAMKNSDSAAQAMGISLLKYRLLAFVIATVYAVLGGALYMLYMRFSIPTSWSLALSLNILAAVVVGGAKSIWGVFLGTFLIFGVQLAVLQNIPFFQKYSDANLIFNGLLIILVVMFYPGGLIRLAVDVKNGIVKLFRKYKEYRYGKD